MDYLSPPLPTVLLHHQTPTDSHFDWMLDRPRVAGAAPGRLWTTRCNQPSWCWVEAGSWLLESIGDHRRDFLQYEGQLSWQRGAVQRVDRGTYQPIEWNDQQIIMDLALAHCHGRVRLVRTGPQQWMARIEQQSEGPTVC